MLGYIKLSLRINHDKIDNDIQANIDACLLDLKRVGIVNIEESDALIKKACDLYVKWQYDFARKGENYEKAYNSLRDALSLCGDYNV